MPTEKFFNLKEGKRQAILEAAGEELLETPYSLLTVSQIIQRAGISRASFYYYFNDKEDLFQHMVEEMKTRFLKDMEKTLRECRGNFAEGFKKMVSSMLEDENLGKRCGDLQPGAVPETGGGCAVSYACSPSGGFVLRQGRPETICAVQGRPSE